MTNLICLLIFGGLLAGAAVHDLRRFAIPNIVPLTLALMAAPAAMVFGHGFGAFADAILPAALWLIAGSVLMLPGLLSGGDVKLIAAALLWLGPAAAPGFLIATGLFGCLLAGMLLALRGAPALTPAIAPLLWARISARSAPVSYALAIAPAGVLAMAARLGAFG